MSGAPPAAIMAIMGPDSGCQPRMHLVMIDSPGVTSHVELEFKLLFHPEDLSALLAAPVIARHATDDWQVSDLISAYYDTPDLDLRSHGSVLRVRTDGAHQSLELKSANPGALERTESTLLREVAEPDMEALARLLPRATFELVRTKPLGVLFDTQVRRHVRTLTNERGTVQLAIDHGNVVAKDRFEAVNEIEIKLLEGSAAAIFLLARDLAANFSLRPSLRSKSARGFDLVLGTAPSPSKPPPIDFSTKSTTDQAMECILRAVFQHLIESLPAAEDGRNAEGVHQYRIALRRLRLALRLLRWIAPSGSLDRFDRDARWLMCGLGDAREWDVLVGETLPTIARGCPSIAGFDILAQTAEAIRRSAYTRARATTGDQRAVLFQIELGLWIEEQGWRAGCSRTSLRRLSAPGASFAKEALARLRRRVLKRGRGFGTLSLEQRHQLRLAAKDLRYAAEFYRPVLSDSMIDRGCRRAASRLQDRLGRCIDMSGLDGLVARMVSAGMPLAGHQAAGALLGWRAASIPITDRDLRLAWRNCRRACRSRM
jgi:inorganic triphosphatase YgiF